MPLDAHDKASRALELYLEHAEIERVLPLEEGRGHRVKLIMSLVGGVAVAAKVGSDAELLIRAKREVAAWLLACELGMRRLVPTTVLREVPPSAKLGETARRPGSAQVLVPKFKTALQAGIDARSLDDHHAWQIAVFDAVMGNTDRKIDNWGVSEGLPEKYVLIDHGHAFGEAGGQSEFMELLRGQTIRPRLLGAIRHFVEMRESSRIGEMLEDDELDRVFDRADELLARERIAV